MKINATTSKFTFLSGPLQVDNLAYKVAHQQFAKYFGSPKVSRRAGGIRRPPLEKKSTYLVGFNLASFFFFNLKKFITFQDWSFYTDPHADKQENILILSDNMRLANVFISYWCFPLFFLRWSTVPGLALLIWRT